MTVTKRGNGYALNGDIHELTEALNLLEYYITEDASWAHNARRRPAMRAKAASYKQLRERLGALTGEESAGGETVVISETIITNADTDRILPFVQCGFDGCEQQIDDPRNRVHCPDCEENYCREHGNPKAHDCPQLVS